MDASAASFLELCKNLRKTGAVKVEQTEHGFSCVWGTVPKPDATPKVEPAPAPVDALADTARPPKRESKKAKQQAVLSEEEKALAALKAELE